MLRVQVAATCNNSCVFCAQAARSDEGAARISEDPRGAQSSAAPLGGLGSEQDLSRDARLLAASESGAPVMLMGGEPTLDPELIAHVQRVAEGGAPVVLQTNARLMACRVDTSGRVASQGDTTLAEALKSAGVVDIEVALYGSTAAQHDFHTRSPGSFRQTLLGVRASRSAGLACSITTLVTRSNYRHLPELVRLAHALGAKSLAVRSVLAEGRAAGSQSLEPPRQMLTPYLRVAQQVARQLGLELSIEPASPANYTDSSLPRGTASSPAAAMTPQSAIFSVQKLVSRREAAPRTGEWAAS